jgi:hypothetical protein
MTPIELTNVDPIIQFTLQDSVDRVVVFGPVVSNPAVPGHYFCIASAGRTSGFRADQIIAGRTRAEATKRRRDVMTRFVAARPVVINDMDDELAMVRLCEALWPGQQVTALRRAVEAERGRANV